MSANGQESLARALVYATSLFACLAWSFSVGKDLNSDSLSYHFYAGFSAVHDRFAQDFNAAGLASYFNPYVHVPLYAMASAGWPSVVVGAVLASFHAVNLWLVYEIGCILNANAKASVARALACVGVLWALLNPVFLQELGSTFADITLSVPVLGSWLLVMRRREPESALPMAMAGLLAGIATALKLSNSIFAIGAGVVVVLLAGTWRLGIRRGTIFAVMCMVGYIVVAGPWAYKLWSTFGNPLFPFGNQFFHSPDLTSGALRHQRFLPMSVLDGVLRPFKIALPDVMVHIETRAPDMRYVALIVLLLGAAIAYTRRAAVSRTPGAGAAAGTAVPGLGDAHDGNRILLTTLGGFFVALALWLGSSANSRYFLPMACLAGALIPACAQRLCGRRRDYLVLITALVIGTQAVLVLTASRSRWAPMEWTGPWFRVEVPERLRKEPFLFLSIDTSNGSFVAPFVAPGSGFMNITGHYVVDPNGPGGPRAVGLIQRYAPRLRTLTFGGKGHGADEKMPIPTEVYDSRLVRFGLRLDPSDCEAIRYRDSRGLRDGENYAGGPGYKGSELGVYWSCAVVPARGGAGKYRGEQLRIDRAFDHVEDACPDLFSPIRTMSEKGPSGWRRLYMNSDIEVWTSNGYLQFIDPVYGGVPLVIGSVEDWEAAPRKLDCSRRHALAGNVMTGSK